MPASAARSIGMRSKAGLPSVTPISPISPFPGNTLLSARTTGLPKDSVANVSRIVALDRSLLSERVGRLAPKPLAQILHGIDVIFGR